MIPLQYIVEPIRLLLTWQPRDESSPERSRRVVGEVWSDDKGQLRFRYLKNQTDFASASEGGFEGFPAFDLRTPEFESGVAETFLRRLPPRNREDFPDFLAQHRLPHPFPGSDMALLGYTGAKLPSDGFSLVPDFAANDLPCDYLTEVAGVRHVFGNDVSSVKAGDSVEFQRDPGNAFDPAAIAVHWHGAKLGYIPRALCQTVDRWLQGGDLTATVERVNGRPERPLIYLRLMAR